MERDGEELRAEAEDWERGKEAESWGREGEELTSEADLRLTS